MAAAGLTAYLLFRSLWPQKSINESMFEQFPELGLFPKDTTFFEKYRYIDMGLSAPQGIGPTFTGSKANKSPSTAVEFKNYTQPYYATFSLEGDLIRRSKSDKALLVDPMKRESSNIIKQWKLDQCRYIWGNGGGALAQLAATSSISGQIMTLKNYSDHRFFRQNMKLNASATDGTSGSVTNTQYVTVAKVHRGTNNTTDPSTITVSEASVAGAISGITDSWYLFRQYVFGNIIPGVEAWCPSTTPSDTFRGVDRSTDPELLGGLRVTVTTKPPRTQLKIACRALADMGGNPNLAVYSTEDWGNLEADLDSAGSLVRTQVMASPLNGMNFGVTYEAIKFMGPTGPVAVVASPNHPVGVAHVFTKENMVLASMGELLHHIDENPVEDAADAKEFRMLGDVDFYPIAPVGQTIARVALV